MFDLHTFECLDEIGLTPGVDELSDGVEGITWPDGRVMLSEKTYCDAVDGNGRARFTVAHEIAHALHHRHLLYP